MSLDLEVDKNGCPRACMNLTIFPPPIYNFLLYTNQYKVEKTVLDCGAGGTRPPLALFFSHGYETYGIDISNTQIARARDFASRNNMVLNIKKEDMRRIPLPNEKFGGVYS